MQRLEEKNANTKEYYNVAIVNHYKELGLDISDAWRIDELLKGFKGGKLLDVGCGISPLCLMAVSKYVDSEVWGLDFADEIIERLKVRYQKIHYIVGDFYTLPFKERELDYVVMGEVIEHSERPQELIDEGFRVLKEGGILTLSTPNEETKETHLYPQHIWSYSIDDVGKMMGGKTFEIKVIGNNIICHCKK